MNKIRFIVSLFTVLIAAASFSDSLAESKEIVSSFFSYSGYSEAAFDSFRKSSQYVEMPDGVKLAVDVFIPSEGPEQESFPTIFLYTPYNRSYLALNMTWWQKLYSRIKVGVWGPVYDITTTLKADPALLLSHGYAIVVADQRGTGASFGTQRPFMPSLGKDGKVIIDWIADQKWSDGNVGMMGESYLGWSQFMTAKEKPKALKAIMPEMILFEFYSEGMRPGGIEAHKWVTEYSEYLNSFNLSKYGQGKYAFYLPATPVIDEDGDGELEDEIPLMGSGDPMTFLDDGDPTYSDKTLRKHHYLYTAVSQHMQNPTGQMFTREQVPFIDSVGPMNTRFYDSSPGYFSDDIIDSKIAIYHLGGWFDGFTKGTIKLYATQKSKNSSRLLIAPRFHFPKPAWINEAYVDYFSYKGDIHKQVAIERLRFFDYHLKGVQNGLGKEKPVLIYVMNEGWREEKEWPLEREKRVTYYFQPNSRLSKQAKSSDPFSYSVDFSHSSSYGTTGVSRWQMYAVPDDIMIRTNQDQKCLVFETDPLSVDMEVTGHPLVNLWVTSNQPNGDFYVYLTDVDEKGESFYVTEGQLRAGWNKLQEDDEQVKNKIDVKPELPWHGFKQSQFEDRALADGKAVNLVFDLIPTSWVFKKGHKVRVAVAGADFPDFELNPGLCSNNDPKTCKNTSINVLNSGNTISSIEIPVIPK